MTISATPGRLWSHENPRPMCLFASVCVTWSFSHILLSYTVSESICHSANVGEMVPWTLEMLATRIGHIGLFLLL